MISLTTKYFLNIKDADKRQEIETHIGWVSFIGLAILTIFPTVVGIVMMHRLRNRFDDMYKEYGCIVQTIMIIQVISILIATVIWIMSNYDSWMSFWT